MNTGIITACFFLMKDPATPDDTTSDVALATVELDVDARIVEHVDGHVLFKYEEADARETDMFTAQLAVEF